jgi:glycine oxidase
MAPGLGPDFTQAVYSREDWRIDAAACLKALRHAAEAIGVEFVRAEAQGFEGADWLVIATGAAQGLSVLAPTLGTLTPIKGQILRLSSAYPGITLRAEGGYVVPDLGGMAVGATMQPGRRDLEVEPDVLAPLHRLAGQLFPDAVEAAFRVQTGIRAATPDGLPMVGRDRHPNVILATGARRNGWLLAPLVARIVVACITEGDAGPYATRLDPRRFAN